MLRGSRGGGRFGRVVLAGAAGLMVVSSVGVLAPVGVVSVLAEPDGTSTYVAQTPRRLADSRQVNNGEAITGGSLLGPGATVEVMVRGAHVTSTGVNWSVPNEAVAVALNVTAFKGTFRSFFTVWDQGPNPGTSTVNWLKTTGEIANGAVVPIGADGKIRFANAFGSVHLIVDVVGYFTAHDAAGGGGSQILSGPGAPTAGDGVEGDYWLNKATSELYGPKAAGLDGWAGLVPLSLAGHDGAPGAPGAPGAKGDQGDPGLPGTPGVQGLPGEDGVVAIIGGDGEVVYGDGPPDANDPADGDVGDIYIDLETGELYGPKTDQGWGQPQANIKGPKGDKGDKGDQGDDGLVALLGADGQIVEGNGVPDAGDGDVGDIYIDVDTGDVYGPKTDDPIDPWGDPSTNLVGEKGDQGDQGEPGLPGQDGADGTTILNGQNAPGAVGGEGDFYIDTLNGNVYGPKTGDVWGNPIPLAGVQGDPGIQGLKGDKGDVGPAGPAAPAGSRILSGGVDPSNQFDGVDGDYYINFKSSTLFGPKVNGAWDLSNGLSLKGMDGPVGPVGPAGADGATILGGNSEPGDADGQPGDFYLFKPKGLLYGPKVGGSWDVLTAISINGVNGADGLDGATILSGNGNPNNGVGDPGDFYLSKDTGLLFGPKQLDDKWQAGLFIDLHGPQGPSGSDGAPGPMGPSGGRIFKGAQNPPPAGTGVMNDYYLWSNGASALLFGPKPANNAWNPADFVNLVGPQGVKGDQGEKGTPGTDGAPGLSIKARVAANGNSLVLSDKIQLIAKDDDGTGTTGRYCVTFDDDVHVGLLAITVSPNPLTYVGLATKYFANVVRGGCNGVNNDNNEVLIEMVNSTGTEVNMAFDFIAA